MKNAGEQFLTEKYPKLRDEPPIAREQKRRERALERVSKKPADKIADWLKIIEKTHIGQRDNPEAMDRIRAFYHRKHVITPEEIPESYWNSQRQKIIDEGRAGDYDTDENGKIIIEDKEEQVNKIIEDQKKSLNDWFDYLVSQDANYPMWAKYWIFTSVTQMGTLEKTTLCATCEKTLLGDKSFCNTCGKDIAQPEDTREHFRYGSRTKGTVAKFPERNSEALGIVTDIVEKKYSKEYQEVEKELRELKKELKTLQKQQRNTTTAQEPNTLTEQVTRKKEAINTLKNRRQKIVLNLHNQDEEKQKEQFQKVSQMNEDFGKLYAWRLEELQASRQESFHITDGEWKQYKKGSDPLTLVNDITGYNTGWCVAGESTAASYLSKGDFWIYSSCNSAGKPEFPRVGLSTKYGEGEENDQKITEIHGVAADQNLDPHISNTDIISKHLKSKEFSNGDTFETQVRHMKQLTEIAKKQEAGTFNAEDPNFEKDIRFLYETDEHIKGFGYDDDPRIAEIREHRDKKEDFAHIYNVSVDEVATKPEEVGYETKVYIGNETYVVDKHTTKEEIDRLSNIPGLRADLTEIDQSIKDTIIQWKGTIKDGGAVVSYNKLQSVAGSFEAENVEILSVPMLESVRNNIYARSAKMFNAPMLKSVGAGLNARSAKMFNAPRLKSVDGYLCAKRTETFDAPMLESVGRELNAESAETFNAPVLKSLRWSLYAQSAETFDAPKLERVGGDLIIRKVKSLKGLDLKNIQIGGTLYINNIPENEREELRKQRPDLNIEPNP